MPVVQIFNKELAPSRAQALKFGLWIGMASILMLFGGITSAYLVRKPVGNWYEFKLPMQFFYSTVIIVLTSVFLEISFKKLKEGKEVAFSRNLLLSLLLGIGFLASQVFAFKTMMHSGLFIDLNVSVSFLYVIAGLHGIHVFGGVVALILSLMVAFTGTTQLNSMRILKFDLLRQYWHFIGVLWIYLLVFLILQ
ncbi:MAG: cytochrome c oxidase subunit 3 [Saprospiraceae bacterium]